MKIVPLNTDSIASFNSTPIMAVGIEPTIINHAKRFSGTILNCSINLSYLRGHCVSRETSAEQPIDIRDAQTVMQSKVQGIGDEPRAVTDKAVDIPRCDEHAS